MENSLSFLNVLLGGMVIERVDSWVFFILTKKMTLFGAFYNWLDMVE
jgi:hypothetical protein